MDTKDNKTAATPGSVPAGQASHASGAPTTSVGGGTPVADPKAQQVKQPVSAPDQGPAGNAAGVPSTTAGNAGGGENATATPGASPVVSTDGAKQAVATNERDVSQGSAAKGGSGTSPITGTQTQEYRLRGHELLQIASQRFGVDTRAGMTEFRWDAANNDLVVRHSPPPNAGVQGGGSSQV